MSPDDPIDGGERAAPGDEGIELDGGSQTGPELAIGLYDRLTGRGAEIVYEFEDVRVDVPSRAGEDAVHARWYLDGTMRIRTNEQGRQRR